MVWLQNDDNANVDKLSDDARHNVVPVGRSVRHSGGARPGPLYGYMPLMIDEEDYDTNANDDKKRRAGTLEVPVQSRCAGTSRCPSASRIDVRHEEGARRRSGGTLSWDGARSQLRTSSAGLCS